jgi:hypothetical protein
MYPPVPINEKERFPMISPKKTRARTRKTKVEPIQISSAAKEAAERWDQPMGTSTSDRSGTAEDQPAEANNQEALDPEFLASIRRDKQAALVAKLKLEARGRGHRPLGELATKEAELLQASTATTHLVKVHNRAEDPTLLAHQLSASVDTQHTSRHLAKQMQSDARRLYAALDSGDPVESIIDRILVASTNVTLGCYQRAGSAQQSNARQVELRWGIKGAEVIGNLIKLRDSRRGAGHQNVMVGQVNVGPGGQAIVGNVNRKKEEEG